MDLTTLINRARNTVNVDRILKNQLLWMLLLRMVLYTLLFIICFIFPGGHINPMVFPRNLFVLLLLAIYLATIISAFVLLIFRGSVRRFGFVQVLFDTVCASSFVFFSGASNSLFTSIFFFPIIAGGLILPRKGGVVAASAASLQYGMLLVMEYQEVYPPYLDTYLVFVQSSVQELLNHFAIHGLTFFLAAILSALFGIRLRKTESALSDSIASFDRLAIFYKQVFDNISTGIITITPEHIITSANRAVRKITGIEPSFLIGRQLEEIFPQIELQLENKRRAMDFKRDDGREIRLGYAHMPIESLENKINDNNQPTEPDRIITLQDISDIEKLERQVRQSEKLAAIGMMSASIAHDFRNPLTAISGSAQVLAAEFSAEGTDNYSNFELTNIILRESNRLIETIGDFLKFSRPEHAKCNWFPLMKCVDEVLKMCRADPQWPEQLKVSVHIAQTLDVWADEKQIFTALTHLIQNSMAFCPKDKGEIIIRAAEKRNNNEPVVSISVSDNGPGVHRTKREQVFEPFFSERPDGTGLGLAIVRQSIEEHGGDIEILDSDTGGATFQFYLPLPY